MDVFELKNLPVVLESLEAGESLEREEKERQFAPVVDDCSHCRQQCQCSDPRSKQPRHSHPPSSVDTGRTPGLVGDGGFVVSVDHTGHLLVGLWNRSGVGGQTVAQKEIEVAKG